MRKTLIRLATAAVLALAAIVPVGATGLALTPEQMIQVAGRAVAQQRPHAALALTDALLAQGHETFQLWLIRSRALRDIGRPDAARTAADHAWTLAQDARQKFTSAVIMAQALSSDGKRTPAQVWLRRAAQYADTPQQIALLRRDFGYVKARNPWRMELSFGATPSSNINGGSAEDQLTLFGLPFELSPSAQALSGFQAYSSGKLSYRLAESAKTRTWIGVEGYTRESWLSAASRTAVDGAVASGDYDYTSTAMTVLHERKLAKPGQKMTFTGKLGRNWYGGDHLSDFASLGMTLALPLQNRARIKLATRLDFQLDAPNDAGGARDTEWVAEATASLFRPTKAGNAWDLGLDLRNAFSNDATRKYREARVGATWLRGQPLFGAYVSLGIELGQRDYDVSYYRANGRHDTMLSGQVQARFPDLSQFGFSPTVTLEHSTTRSNIELYSSDRTNLSLGFVSDF